MWSVSEVVDVCKELGSKASRLLGAAVPLEVQQQLTVSGEKPTPAVGGRATFLALSVGGRDLVLADPVIEAEIAALSCCSGEAHEELVGLQLVDEVEVAFQGVLRTLEVGPRIVVAPFCQQRGPPPREQINGSAADPAGSSGGTPGSDQPLVEQAPEAVLTASGAREEEGLDLVSVQISV